MNYNEYRSCKLCARVCGVNRAEGQLGFCRMGATPYIARAALHFWEEPVISGTHGSGAVFFSGCSLGCVFCQNVEISRGYYGKTVTDARLSEIMLELKDKGAHNINFVTPTHFVPSIKAAVALAREHGMDLPIVYNTGTFDTVKTVKALADTVDIYLADYKFYLESTAEEYCKAPSYPKVAFEDISEMVKQKGEALIEDGIMKRGVIVRILLLPGHLAEAKLSVKRLYETFGDDIYFSLMNQYTPMKDMRAPLDRKVTVSEYRELVEYAISKGIKNAFTQESGTAEESFIPPFDMSGV